MADDYDYDGDGFMDAYDDDWLYVEDEFALADELAETQIADPGYAGTNNELEMESYEYDLYGYWDELEYANDEYWEYAGRRPGQDMGSKTGSKRKRAVPGRPTHLADKRRRVSANGSKPASGEAATIEPVLFQSRQERLEVLHRKGPVVKDATPFALLPDWRDRFANDEGALSDGEMPVDMLRAAEAADHDTPDRIKNGVNQFDDAADEDWEDEEEDEDALSSIDPEMLKSILRQKLGEVGLGGMVESDFMANIAKMLNGADGAEEAAGKLASAVLDKATGGDATVSGWLSQQGVSLDATGDDDETSSVATLELPDGTSKHHNQVSPSDSVIGGTSGSLQKSDAAKEMVLHPSSPEQSIQQTPSHNAKKNRKSSKTVKFDVPPSSEPTSQTNDAVGEIEPTKKRQQDASSDPLTSESMVQSRTSKRKAVDVAAPEISSKQVYDTQRQTRKRKAASADGEMVNTKRTRSTRKHG